MFCEKCGAELGEGKFCPECGTKNEEIETSTQNQEKKQADDTSKNTNKKTNPNKRLIMLGAVVLAVIAGIIIAMNWDKGPDYIATVKAHTPFAVSQGLPYTYEEVLDKYFESLVWKVREDGNVGFVDISGGIKGTDGTFSLTVQVTSDPDDPDIARMKPISIMLGDRKSDVENEVVGVLYNLFCLYDEGVELPETQEEYTSLQGEISLTETFTDENSGISFRYPEEWVILDSPSEFQIVEMIDSRNTPEHIASFKISMSLDRNPYGVFTEDEESVRKSVLETMGEPCTILDFGDVMIGNVPAKALKMKAEDLTGDSIVVRFWYMIGEDVYQIICSYTEAAADIYESLFEAIMNSYTINSAAPMNSDTGTDIMDIDIRFNGISVSELLNFSAVEIVQQFGGGYNADGNGRIAYDEIEFYMLDDETVGYICSFRPEYFSINGNPLIFDSEGVISSEEVLELLGTNYEDEWLDSGYYKTYYYPTFTFSLGINKFSEVSDIRIYNLIAGENGTNISMGYQEPIENYYKLSGAYAGSAEQAVLYISIYSSQEEGEIEIGNTEIYTGNGQHFFGTIVPIGKDVYQVMTDTGEEVLLIDSIFADNIVLQLYVDGQYVEEYHMVEHYES